MNKHKQIKAMGLEMKARGYTVTLDAPASDLELVLNLTFDILAIRGDEKVIIEVVSLERDRDEAMRRFEVISEAIADRPEIDFQIRFTDCSAQINKLEDAVRKNAATSPDYAAVLALMQNLGLAGK